MYRRNALFLAGAACVLVAPATLNAQDTAGSSLTTSEHQARGRASDWLIELCQDVTRDPDSPTAYAALGRIRGLMDSANDPTIVEKTLDPVLAGGVSDGETDELLRDVLSRRARARGDLDGSRAYRNNAGYIRQFAALGPLDGSGSANIWRRYAPESGTIDFTQSVESKRGTARWLKLPVLGSSSWVSPYGQIRRNGTGLTFAVAHVRVPRAMTVGMKLWCSRSCRVAVNGTDAIVADRNRERTARVLWGSTRLEAGWNRVLVKIAGNTNFALKFTDPGTGKPIEGLEEGDAFETDIVRSSGVAPDPVNYRRPWERARDAAGEGASVHDLAVAAILADREGRDWESLGLWERAANSVKSGASIESANVRAAYGRALASFSTYPQVHRKALAKVQFELALKHDAEHNSARIRLANYENDDDRPEKAVAALQAYLEKNPSPTALMALATVSKQRGWEKEALDAATTASALEPNSVSAMNFLSAYDRRYGNFEVLLKRTRHRLSIDAADTRAASDLISSLRARGQDAEALAELRKLATRYPASLSYRRQIAEILRVQGDLDGCLAQWRELAEMVPEEDRYPREIAELLDVAGKKEEALAAYRKSLELSPAQPQVWRSIGRLTGEDFDFAVGWEPDVEQIMSELPSTEELRKTYPKAVAITVLDHSVERVNADGSSVSFVNMLYKVLDEKGVQKYSDVQNSGELLEIAAHLPDGKRMLPTGLGGSRFNMEGLVPGSFVHHRYVAFKGPRADGAYNGGKFYFQDYDLRRNPNPVLRSRMVLLTPKDMSLPHKAQHFPDGAETKEFEGLTATIWEKRDMPRIDSEANMPPVDEIVPFVDYGKAPTFEDANWTYLGAGSGTWPTPPLRDIVAKVCTDDMDDRAKLEALNRWVNVEITGNSGTTRNPTATVIEKAGNRSSLFEALVRTAEIPYTHGRAMAWNGVGSDLSEATPAAFSARFLWLKPRGSAPIPFFMGARLAPFGVVPSPYRDSAAFLVSQQGGQIIRLPAGGHDVRSTTALEVRLGADESDVQVKAQIVIRSPGGYRGKKQVMEYNSDIQTKICENQLAQFFAGAKLTDHAMPDLATHGKPLAFNVAGSMASYLSAQGDVFIASMSLPKVDMNARFVHRSERKYDLILRPRSENHDRLVIDMGDNFELVRVPDDHLAVNDVGVYSLTFRREGTQLIVERSWQFKPARYKPDQYPRFIEWCKAIDDAEGVQFEFRKVQ